MELKQLRTEKGITQIEMSKIFGISYQNYRNYEAGKYKAMRGDLERKISDYFEVEYRYGEN